MHRNISTFSLLLIIYVLSNVNVAAQNTTKTRIKGDMKVSLLVAKHINFNERNKTLPGYRIQVASLSGNDSKRRAFALKDKIKENFSEIPVYVVYEEPNFKVKVGDFTSRLEAYELLSRIKSSYPGTIVKDNVYILPQIEESETPTESEDRF